MDDTELAAALLQDAEQPLALDAAEAVAARARHRAAVMDVDVVPVVEIAGDRGVRGLIRGAEVLHRAVREHDAPAEGVVRAVALVDFDARAR
jgi:predicted DsbA family dithiol-disulfide isomerase